MKIKFSESVKMNEGNVKNYPHKMRKMKRFTWIFTLEMVLYIRWVGVQNLRGLLFISD